jgi:hypothetical protein
VDYSEEITEYEQKMQSNYKELEHFRGEVFLHKSRINIDKVPFVSNNLNMFENECEGYCGV